MWLQKHKGKCIAFSGPFLWPLMNSSDLCPFHQSGRLLVPSGSLSFLSLSLCVNWTHSPLHINSVELESAADICIVYWNQGLHKQPLLDKRMCHNMSYREHHSLSLISITNILGQVITNRISKIILILSALLETKNNTQKKLKSIIENRPIMEPRQMHTTLEWLSKGVKPNHQTNGNCCWHCHGSALKAILNPFLQWLQCFERHLWAPSPP